MIPDADTVLAAGDRLIVLGPEATWSTLEAGAPLPAEDEAVPHLAVD